MFRLYFVSDDAVAIARQKPRDGSWATGHLHFQFVTVVWCSLTTVVEQGTVLQAEVASMSKSNATMNQFQFQQGAAAFAVAVAAPAAPPAAAPAAAPAAGPSAAPVSPAAEQKCQVAAVVAFACAAPAAKVTEVAPAAKVAFASALLQMQKAKAALSYVQPALLSLPWHVPVLLPAPVPAYIVGTAAVGAAVSEPPVSVAGALRARRATF